MVDVILLIRSILLFIALGVPGYILGKSGKSFADGAEKALSVLLTDVAMSALVFVNAAETDVKSLDPGCFAVALLAPFIMTLLLLLVCKAVFGQGKDAEERTATVCAVFPNCGFLGIPLIKSAFPTLPQALVYISVFNVTSTVCLVIFSGGILSGGKAGDGYLKILRIPVLWAFIVGAALSFTPSWTVSAVLREYAGYFSLTTTPLAMTVLGIIMSKPRAAEKGTLGRLSRVALIRLIVSPLIALGMLTIVKYALRPDAPNMTSLAAALFIAAGVSTAASAPALSERYGSGGDCAAVCTVGTTLACAVTLPLISLLMNLFFS